MSFLMKVLSTIFLVLYRTVPMERKLVGEPRKEVFCSKSIVYEIETLTVMYVLQGRVRVIPNMITYGMVIRGRATRNGEEMELGTKEYPLLVPRIFKDSNIAHIVTRRQYISDISEEL